MFSLFSLIFNKPNYSANIALERLNDIISQLPNISDAEIELLQKDLLSCLDSKYGFNKNKIKFKIEGNTLIMNADMKDIIR